MVNMKGIVTRKINEQYGSPTYNYLFLLIRQSSLQIKSKNLLQGQYVEAYTILSF